MDSPTSSNSLHKQKVPVVPWRGGRMVSERQQGCGHAQRLND
jgi:hypothetical protein